MAASCGSRYRNRGSADDGRVARGADTYNTPSDRSLAQLAAVRAAIDIPIDIYIESPDDSARFIRYYDALEKGSTALKWAGVPGSLRCGNDDVSSGRRRRRRDAADRAL